MKKYNIQYMEMKIQMYHIHLYFNGRTLDIIVSSSSVEGQKSCSAFAVSDLFVLMLGRRFYGNLAKHSTVFLIMKVAQSISRFDGCSCRWVPVFLELAAAAVQSAASSRHKKNCPKVISAVNNAIP